MAVEHGVTQNDEVCIVGQSNLLTFFETIPPYWRTELSMFHERIGDPSTTEGRQALLDISPLTHVARIDKPLLIATAPTIRA